MLALYFGVSGFAWAYIDPNTAGIVYQFLLPVFAAILGFWRWLKMGAQAAWSRIAQVFRKKKEDEPHA